MLKAWILAGCGLLAATFITPSAAAAAPPVSCPPGAFNCDVGVGTPGHPGGPGGPGGGGDSDDGTVCILLLNEVVIPCQRPDYGWWSARDQCYYKVMSPQPDADTAPGMGEPQEGFLAYEARCATSGSPSEWDYVWAWFREPPDGTPVTPAELARRATDSMTLLGPDIRTSVRAGGTGLVGVPVWFWTTTGPTRWGPNSATASVPGLSVTATARATKIVWQLGDGTTMTCTGPGTPYDAGAGRISSPTCGHTYQRSSARFATQAYPISATTTWQVSWVGGGQSGALTRTRTSTASLPVGELQVLIR